MPPGTWEVARCPFEGVHSRGRCPAGGNIGTDRAGLNDACHPDFAGIAARREYVHRDA